MKHIQTLVKIAFFLLLTSSIGYLFGDTKIGFAIGLIIVAIINLF